MQIIEKDKGRIILTSPAKINLFLKLIKKRDDGYHNILTLMQKISLCDLITLKKNTKDPFLELKTNLSGVPEKDNLAFRAAEMFFENAGLSPNVKIVLEKHIPVGGGLGGGSSNAASVLYGLNRLYGFPLSLKNLYEIAVLLGADVAFFLKKGSWILKGRGDVFIRKVASKPFYYLLFNFGKSSHTKTVYAKSRCSQHPDIKNVSSVVKGLQEGKVFLLKRKIANDLLAPFLNVYPEQREIFIDLKKKMCKNLFLSGSGATLFSIFYNKELMRRAFFCLDNQTKKYVTTVKGLK
ncbi:MAG: 4-(cytidine 5'-diphospho)-2-C-methyl-D-erythritol kinase [Candidatus Aureabacteria bacterium]|nr:4-(cytidine 5'-diphospho)-2-C-methyl-D-erythritol kinase [Candidatus Auribacterota bacterium]